MLAKPPQPTSDRSIRCHVRSKHHIEATHHRTGSFGKHMASSAPLHGFERHPRIRYRQPLVQHHPDWPCQSGWDALGRGSCANHRVEYRFRVVFRQGPFLQELCVACVSSWAEARPRARVGWVVAVHGLENCEIRDERRSDKNLNARLNPDRQARLRLEQAESGNKAATNIPIERGMVSLLPFEPPFRVLSWDRGPLFVCFVKWNMFVDHI